MTFSPLTQKERDLGRVIVLPDASDYGLHREADEVREALVAALNQVLCGALDALNTACKEGRTLSYRDLMALLYPRLFELAIRHRMDGLSQERVCEVAGRFFGANLRPAFYEIMRFPPERLRLHK